MGNVYLTDTINLKLYLELKWVKDAYYDGMTLISCF